MNDFIPENTIVLPNTSSKRIISFDIGIKNLSYCIFEIIDGSSSILDWRTVNLMESGDINEPIYCNTIIVPKRVPKKDKGMSNTVVLEKKCGKTAKYQKDECYFCETHAKSSKWILPKKTFESSSLLKYKSAELLNYYNTVMNRNDTKKTKKDMVDELLLFYKDKCLEIARPIGSIPLTNSKQFGMITLSKNMKRILDTMPFFDGFTHVIIENQISTIASRMNNIQGILTMYFIMKYENTQTPKLEYISSFNKLKNFVKIPDTIINNEPKTNSEKYKQHKKDGVIYTGQILDKNPNLSSWKHVLDNKKNDDYADCFLQCVFYMEKHFNIKLT